MSRYAVEVTTPNGVTRYQQFGSIETGDESRARKYLTADAARKEADRLREQWHGQSVHVAVVDLDDECWQDSGE